MILPLLFLSGVFIFDRPQRARRGCDWVGEDLPGAAPGRCDARSVPAGCRFIGPTSWRDGGVVASGRSPGRVRHADLQVGAADASGRRERLLGSRAPVSRQGGNRDAQAAARLVAFVSDRRGGVRPEVRDHLGGRADRQHVETARRVRSTALNLHTRPGNLTIGTGNPAYPPWYGGKSVDGLGLEVERRTPATRTRARATRAPSRYALAKQMGFTPDQVTWVGDPVQQVVRARAEGLRLRDAADLDHAEAREGGRLQRRLLRREPGADRRRTARRRSA